MKKFVFALKISLVLIFAAWASHNRLKAPEIVVPSCQDRLTQYRVESILDFVGSAGFPESQ